MVQSHKIKRLVFNVLWSFLASFWLGSGASFWAGTLAFAFEWSPDRCTHPSGLYIDRNSRSFGHSSLSQSRQLDQGETDTCYLHVSKQILEHYHHPSDPSLDFSFHSLIEACPRQADQAGQVSSILHNLRRLRKPMELYQGNHSEHQIADCRIQERIRNPLSVVLGNQSTSVEDTLNVVDEINKKVVNLDYDYNVHVKETFGVVPTEIQKEIEETLVSTSTPFALGLDDHVVTVVGTGIVCCGSHDCKKRILIRGSFGSVGNGWYSSDRMTKALSQSLNGQLSFLRKCDSSEINHPNVEKCDPDTIHGEYPLLYLVEANDPRGISLHIQKKGSEDVNQARIDGLTPLHLAVQLDYLEPLKVLVKHADPNRTLNDGATAAYLASEYGRTEALRILAEHKANLNLATHEGFTPAFIAALRGHLGILKVLIEYGVDLNQATKAGITPAFAAAQEGHSEVLELLAQHHALLNQPSHDGETPAVIAAQEGHTPCLKVLAEHGVDLNQTNSEGVTLAHRAAFGGHPKVLQFLGESGVDLNKPLPDGGDTPAHTAVTSSCLECLKALDEAGVTFSTKNQEGKTPLDLALELEDQPMVEYLRRAQTVSPKRNKNKTNLMSKLKRALKF